MNKRTKVGGASPFLYQSLVHQSWRVERDPVAGLDAELGSRKGSEVKQRGQRVVLASFCFGRCIRLVGDMLPTQTVKLPSLQRSQRSIAIEVLAPKGCRPGLNGKSTA